LIHIKKSDHTASKLCEWRLLTWLLLLTFCQAPQRAEIVHNNAAPAIDTNPKWFDAEPREEGIESIRIIMKDGNIYKNTL
jgi:hypothetical protein